MKSNSYRLMRQVAVFLPLLLVFSYPQETSGTGEFLKRFEGAWVGDGQAFGNVARLRLNYEWVLGGKFLRLSLKNEMQIAGGQKQVFEGSAFYRATSDRDCQGTWFDSRGESYQIKCSFEDNALTVLWGAVGKEEGKSAYRLLDSNKLEVVDSVKQKDGTWKEFATFVVARE